MSIKNSIFSLVILLALTRSFTEACENGTEYECNNGQCISTDLTCDGFWDCPDGEDESYTGACSCDGFVCDEGQECISEDWICDDYVDCLDGTDEPEDCPPPPPCDGFECPNGDCLSADWQCDGYNDCGDWADEVGCECAVGEVNCGRCIPEAWWCDTVEDCPDGQDEANCTVSAISHKAHNQLALKHTNFLRHRQAHKVPVHPWTPKQRAFKRLVKQGERRRLKIKRN